jgi:hypothetical protein
MVLLGDEAQVDACIGLFADSANLECTRWISYVTLVVWNLISIHLETVVVLVQERRTVCAKCTIGIEIVLDAPDGTPR